MALVTYILLVALQGGLQKRFDPREFAGSASKAIGVLTVDYLFTKGGCYILGVQGAMQSFDLVSYGGYKFVGCVCPARAVEQVLSGRGQGDRDDDRGPARVRRPAVRGRVRVRVPREQLLPRACAARGFVHALC
jgi:hypothetical protein